MKVEFHDVDPEDAERMIDILDEGGIKTENIEFDIKVSGNA